MTVAVCLMLALAAALVYCDEPSGDKYDCRHDNTVHTTHGRVQGQTLNIPVNNGRHVTVDSYWGIPYAQPPVGDLRFRRPVAADPWDGVLQAKTPPNSCVQVPLSDTAPFPAPLTPSSEDCLYVNIWSPSCEDNLTTMVWVHGELFTFGSSVSDLYNGTILAASQCVIVVSVNYRLGALGFMYLDTPGSPGNMGLSDLALALQWIKDNVVKFGGDASSITLFGGVFGGDLVSLMLLSPLTRHLFKNAILQSGSSDLRFVHRSQQASLATALKFAESLNCSSGNRSAIVECLKQVEPAQLALQYLILMSTFQDLMVAVTDGHFLTTDPRLALKTGDFKRCEIIAGNNQDEGTYSISIGLMDTFKLRQQPPALTDQGLDSNLTVLLSTILKPDFIPDVISQVKLLYNLKRLTQEARRPRLDLLNRVATDALTRCATRRLAAAYANVSQNVYLYSFNHARDISSLATWAGATLGIEIPFVFGTTSPDFPAFSPRETKLKQSVMELWANFAKYGKPTPDAGDTPRWPTYSPSGPANILEFSQSTQIRAGRTRDRGCDFWDSLPREYLLD